MTAASRSIATAMQVITCPNCREPMLVGIISSSAGRPTLTMRWSCGSADGCKVTGEGAVALIPLTDDVPS